MAGDQVQRNQIVQLHRGAVDRALHLFATERLLDVRLGQGGYIRQAPTDIIVGRFPHFTSREGDCNLHEHCVLINVLGCRDGKWRTAETERAFANLLVLGAAYRAELASGLCRMGFHLREAGRGQFEIAGIPESLIKQFSKRSAQIEKEVGRDASTLQKGVATLATRASKEEVPIGVALEERWKQELSQTRAAPWENALSFRPRFTPFPEPEFTLDPAPIESDGPVSKAASERFRHQSVIERKDLLRDAFVNATWEAKNVDDVFVELTSIEERGQMIALAGTQHASCWTSPIIAEKEASLLRSADRHHEREWLDPDHVTNAIVQAEHLSEEQAAAIRLACGRDGVTICEAAAGTGKTTLARVIVKAAHHSGLEILGLAPTWVAADELSRSTKISSQSIAKWRFDNRRGDTKALTSNNLIIIDEVSLCGMNDLEDVLRKAAEAKAKVICLGDRRQLEAVANGNPLKALHEITKRSATMSEVRRQHVGWQRSASILMAKGDVASGLRAYARNGKVKLIAGDKNVHAQAIQYWSEWRAQFGDDVILVTRRNVDANSLNQAARSVLRAEGRLLGPDVTVEAVDREKRRTTIAIARGDRIRFSENLPMFGIRNGTRGTILEIEADKSDPSMSIQLEDGTLINQVWSALARDQFGTRSPPRVSLAYAGTAYSVQGRTASAAILVVTKATDAREIYVGLTRHQRDAILIAERDRLLSAGIARQSSIAVLSDQTMALEQLYSEASRYSEKANVVDYVRSRPEFIRTGIVDLHIARKLLDLPSIARAARSVAMHSSLREIIGTRIRANEDVTRAGAQRSAMSRQFDKFISTLTRKLRRIRAKGAEIAHNIQRSYDVTR
jgi:hypothetical protein